MRETLHNTACAKSVPARRPHPPARSLSDSRGYPAQLNPEFELWPRNLLAFGEQSRADPSVPQSPRQRTRCSKNPRINALCAQPVRCAATLCFVCTAALYKRGTGFAVHDFSCANRKFLSTFYESILSRARERGCARQNARGAALRERAALSQATA